MATTVTVLDNTIDVMVRGIGYCKCIAWIDYGQQVNTMWKCRVYATGRVINAYDDDVIICGNMADGETNVVPDDWVVKGNAAELRKEFIKEKATE